MRSGAASDAFGGASRAFEGRVEDGFGILSRYLSSIGARNGTGSKSSLTDLSYLLANPSSRRFLSSKAPKKKSKRSSKIAWTLFYWTNYWLYLSSSLFFRSSSSMELKFC